MSVSKTADQSGLSSFRPKSSDFSSAPVTEPNWEALIALAETAAAAQQPDFSVVARAILEAGKALTRVDFLAIYLAEGSTPELQQLALCGELGLLPEKLPAEDLIALGRPGVWRYGRRPTAFLHRMGYTSSLAFIATATVGKPGAATGLLALANREGVPPVNIVAAASLLAALLSSLLQIHAQFTRLRETLEDTRQEISIQAALESSMTEGAFLLTPDLALKRLNTAAEQMLGFSNKEVIGQPVDKILIGHEGLYPALVAAQQGSPTYNLENAHFYRRNGEAFLAQARIFPILENSQVQAIMILLQDLSEQEQIRLQTQHLEQRALLGEVTASFAHEVRNPINNISTGLQLLALNLPADDPNQAAITRHLQDCDRLAELITSVLAFSRPVEYEMEALSLEHLLRSLLDRLHPRLARQKIQVSLQTEAECPLVWGNLRALEQVFSNLINNAAKAMGENGGTLALRIQPVPTPNGLAYIETSVADTGPGIPKEIMDRIFQPFFTTEREGTGLGLAIARRIITAHKGTLRVTSFPGGTVFYIQLPIASTTANPNLSPRPSSEETS